LESLNIHGREVVGLCWSSSSDLNLRQDETIAPDQQPDDIRRGDGVRSALCSRSTCDRVVTKLVSSNHCTERATIDIQSSFVSARRDPVALLFVINRFSICHALVG